MGQTLLMRVGLRVEAVATTGIYCRAECSAQPHPRNVSWYPSSVAAEAAGYRPCLRCRPERRAGTLADLDVPAPVAAALLAITDGFLDDHDEETLAARVGYSGRQLRRLFEIHVGATPAAIARSRRAHFARRLIDDTDLPFDAIARAAGLGGSRQLHRAMTTTFKFTPSELRSKRRRGERPCLGGGLELLVPYVAPFDFGTFARHQATRAIPGVEAVTAGTYRRSISTCGRAGVAEVSDACDGEHVRLRLHLPTYDSIIDDVARCRTLLGADADPADATTALGDDLLIGPLVRSARGLRVPRSWDRFETAVRIVVGQQISLAGASTMCGRIVARLGTPIAAPAGDAGGGENGTPLTHLFPSAVAIADGGAEALAGLGFTQRRIDTIVGLSQAVADGDIDLRTAEPIDDAVARLCELPGIGPWSAHLISMRVLGHDDAFPAGDLGLRRNVSQLVGHDVTARELEAMSERWRPYRAWAAQHLWHAGNAGAGRAAAWSPNPAISAKSAVSAKSAISSPTDRSST